jgi:hypothetical protein
MFSAHSEFQITLLGFDSNHLFVPVRFELLSLCDIESKFLRFITIVGRILLVIPPWGVYRMAIN